MTSLSDGYGKYLDGVLGYSFLKDKTVLINYPRRTLLLDPPGEAKPLVRDCRRECGAPLVTVESFPVIRSFHFGNSLGPVSIDTGSNGGIALYQSGLALTGVAAALSAPVSIAYGGVRGSATAQSYALDMAVGFGPFELAPGERVTVRKAVSSRDTRLANIGNALLSAMHVNTLLDYRHRQRRFFGDCRDKSD